MRSAGAALALAFSLAAPAWSQSDTDPDAARLTSLVEQPQAQAPNPQVKVYAGGLGAEQGFGTDSPGITITTRGGVLSVGSARPREQPQPQAVAPVARRDAPPPNNLLYLVLGLAGAVLVGMALAKGKALPPPAPQSAPERAPSWQTNYPIVRTLGEGGMGVVYEAVDRALDRRVAIKKMREDIRDDPRQRESFIKEARVVAALHHPNIVDIHAVVEQAGEVYIVFEYVDGKTVQQLMDGRKRFTLQETQGILRPVCEALQFAHDRKIVHRDLKPSNVMINVQGTVKVMDFGLARRGREAVASHLPSGAGWDKTNTVCGTPLYMPPEAERGVLGPESDVYSLGVMAYEMLTGSPPFPPPATASQKETRSYRRLGEVLPAIAPQVGTLIDDALEPDPLKRLHTPREFWQRLAGAKA